VQVRDQKYLLCFCNPLFQSMIKEYKGFIAKKCEELRIHEEVSADYMIKNVLRVILFIKKEKNIIPIGL
jgi:hypothetical protein